MNATQLAAFRTAAQGTMETLFPATVTIAGQSYSGSTSGLKRNPRELVDGGQLEMFEITFRVRRELFVAAGKSVPEDGQRASWNGMTLKIESVTNDPSDVAVTFRCAQPVAR